MRKRFITFFLIAALGFVVGIFSKTNLFLSAFNNDSANALLPTSKISANEIYSVRNSKEAGATLNQSNVSTSDPVKLVNQAQDLAQQGKFLDAIAVLDKIKPANQAEAKTILQVKQRWADEIFKRSLAKYEQGKITAAIEIAETVPPNTSAGKQYAKLRKDWYESATLFQIAERFHRQGRCTTALETLSLITDPALQDSQEVQDLKAVINAGMQSQAPNRQDP